MRKLCVGFWRWFWSTANDGLDDDVCAAYGSVADSWPRGFLLLGGVALALMFLWIVIVVPALWLVKHL